MKKNALLSLLFVICTTFSGSTWPKIVASEINRKPINIDSDYQKIDIPNDTMTFIGNVVIIQDTLHLRADKVIVNRMKSTENKRIIAIGSPAIFQQKLGKNKKVDGSANKLVYDVKENKVTLMGKASLTHGDNTIHSQIVRYNIADQQIIANSNPSERVKTTLVPEQLSELKN